MNLDPGIVCYQHCEGRLFSFSLPSSCYLCGADLSVEPLTCPPFSDYRSSNDLHIGVTDSEGRVFEYDHEGLHSDYTSSWTQSLAVSVISDPATGRLDPVWLEYWDFTLHTMAQDPTWAEDRYDETSFNCYSFVLEFLKKLGPPGIKTKGLSKTSLCEQLLVPHTTAAAKYISLYRKLRTQTVVAVPPMKQ
ncbi:MKRN2 opposite strand protein-like isoform X2 [Penaeus chinensis]|uniref:MKRN2 opposite strand protein-like isoform X2 n=1 Tax=Penaeus chinensis TaxID=139456 RepID=UPI001FB74806|nr:MKRN2 opposite strand protein-like isoform X2 [Penaeus chinensis]